MVGNESYLEFKKITASIDGCLRRINEQTGLQSSLNIIRDLADYKELIDRGPRIIPYIIHRMVHRGISWVDLMLLRELSGANPVPLDHQGKFYHQIADWMKWYVNSDYYKKDNTYCGLVD